MLQGADRIEPDTDSVMKSVALSAPPNFELVVPLPRGERIRARISPFGIDDIDQSGADKCYDEIVMRVN
jgi:hypothetical protein